jgi:hypothetical protein
VCECALRSALVHASATRAGTCPQGSSGRGERPSQDGAVHLIHRMGCRSSRYTCPQPARVSGEAEPLRRSGLGRVLPRSGAGRAWGWWTVGGNGVCVGRYALSAASTAACCWSAVQAMIERGHLKPPARLQLRGVEVVLCVQQGAHRTAWSCPPDTRCHARPCLQCSPASWA